MTTNATLRREDADATAAGDVHAIVNPASGSSVDEDALRAALRGVTWHHTTEDDPGTGVARRVVAEGATTVVACGGDGTVRAVLEGVAGSPCVLGVVSLGTGNLLATNLDLPLAGDDLAAAARTATTGPVRRIDVGTVNGERFAVMAGIGFDAAMIRDADPKTKRRFGSVAYVASAARNLPAKLVRAHVSVDGAPVWQGRTAMVLVGNCGTVSGGLEVFPDARMDDGLLDVAVLSAGRLRDWMSVLWRLVRSRPQRPDLVVRFRGHRVEVQTDEPEPWELDGEDRDPTRTLTFTIEPTALAVRVRDEEER